MSTHRPKYAYADLYGMMVKRQERYRNHTIQLIRSIERMRRDGFHAPGLDVHLAALKRSIPNGPPARRWLHAIGLSVTAQVSKGAASGTYKLTVIRSNNPDGFELLLKGPKRSIVWSPSTGVSETSAFLAIGGWRHTLSRFFGLEIRVSGLTKTNKRRRSGSKSLVVVQAI